MSLPTISVSDVTVSESAGGATFTLRLSSPAGVDGVSVLYTTDPGTAKSYDDYTGQGGTISFAAGQRVAQVSIPIKGDTVAEQTEAFTLRLYGAVNANIGRSQATATILDDDGAAVSRPFISISDAVVDESGGYAEFVVSLDAPATGTVSFDYATVGGTAKAGADFTGTNGHLTLRPGDMTTTIRVPVLNDARAEGDEYFGLQLGNIQGAYAADTTGQAIIAASDQPSTTTPTISISDVTVSESAGVATFTLRLSSPAGVDGVSVLYTTDPGTAKSYDDYTGQGGAISFAAGQRVAQVSIPIKGDTVAEQTEAFTLRLYGAVNANIGRSQATATILDDQSHVLGTASCEQLSGSSKSERIDAFGGDDTVLGGAGNDSIYGGTGADYLNGHEGDDILYAGSGRDTLNGGEGKDLLYGGKDAKGDVFIFISHEDSGVGRANRDVIFGFTSGSDYIDLRKIDANMSTSENDEL